MFADDRNNSIAYSAIMCSMCSEMKWARSEADVKVSACRWFPWVLSCHRRSSCSMRSISKYIDIMVEESSKDVTVRFHQLSEASLIPKPLMTVWSYSR